MSDPIARRDVVCSLEEPGWNYGHGRSPFYRYDLADGAAYCIADDLEPRRASVVGFDLADHPCEIIDLPFYDADKKIPRGLETPIV